MANQLTHKRHRSQFQKGMTLQQYLRGMDTNQETIPTADSAFDRHHEQQQSLYKTSHYFYNPGFVINSNCIKQMDQENFQDSIDIRKDYVNIVSSNMQLVNKKTLLNQANFPEQKKIYRIRNGKSMSPYNQNTLKIQNKKAISPYKTFMKKFYDGDQQISNNNQSNLRESHKMSMAKTLHGKQFQIRKSIKNINIDSMIPSTRNNFEYFERQTHQHHQKLGLISRQKQREKQKINQVQRVDIRIQTLKDRLQMKRKNRNKP